MRYMTPVLLLSYFHKNKTIEEELKVYMNSKRTLFTLLSHIANLDVNN